MAKLSLEAQASRRALGHHLLTPLALTLWTNALQHRFLPCCSTSSTRYWTYKQNKTTTSTPQTLFYHSSSVLFFSVSLKPQVESSRWKTLRPSLFIFWWWERPHSLVRGRGTVCVAASYELVLHVACHVGQCWDRPGMGGVGRNEVWGGPRARWGDAVPTFPSPPWEPAFIYLEKGINAQANAKLQVHFLGWAPQPFPWLSSGLSWHVLLSCCDFQLLHSEVIAKSYLFYTLPFSFHWLLYITGSPSDMCT